MGYLWKIFCNLKSGFEELNKVIYQKKRTYAQRKSLQRYFIEKEIYFIERKRRIYFMKGNDLRKKKI